MHSAQPCSHKISLCPVQKVARPYSNGSPSQHGLARMLDMSPAIFCELRFYLTRLQTSYGRMPQTPSAFPQLEMRLSFQIRDGRQNMVLVFAWSDMQLEREVFFRRLLRSE